MPNVPGVVVIATEKLDSLTAERDELRVQVTEEHAAFLAEQVAGQDARRELEIALEEGEGLRATLNAVGSTRDYLREQLSRHHGGTAGCAVCGDYAMESAHG